jgi:uncharacterized protein (UPF0333 family)
MNPFRRLIERSRDDAGAAMITTLLVGAVLTALGIVAVDVSISNLQNAGRDRVGGIALDTSESGVAQAIEFIKNGGGAELTGCFPNCTSPWGNTTNPKTVTLPNGRQYKVYIKPIQAYAPPTYKSATYKIFSLGTAGAGPGSRNVEMTISAKPFTFPIGLYADNFEDAGSGTVHSEQMFSKGCITGRSHMNFGGSTDPETGVVSTVDPFYGYPPAAHSANYITESNSSCSNGSSIHSPDKCNTTYPGDQDAAGGSVLATGCASVVMGGTTSLFTVADLNATYGYQARGLTASQYASLKTKAISQGNYWTNATLGDYVAPCVDACPAGKTPTPNGVLYFNVAAGTNIDNEFKDIEEFTRSTCGTRSLVIVIEGGDAHIDSNIDITGALFVPDGNLQFNGNASIEGTIFAKTVNKFNGTADFYLDPCFIKNFPGGLFDVTPMRFREVDRPTT